jgi:hypothetical protein
MLAHRELLFLVAISLIGCYGCRPHNNVPVTMSANDNPFYRAWAQHKPGSSEVLDGDIIAPSGKSLHVEITFTLISVTDKDVTIRTSEKFSGKSDKPPDSVRTHTDSISSTSESENDVPMETTEKIEAIGKTYNCMVFQGNDVLFSCGTGKWKYFFSSDVPGGMVGFDGTDPDNAPFSVRLRSFIIK